MPSAGVRRAVGVVLLLSVLGPVTNAQALDPPALLYREGVTESEPLGPWLPLDGAHINSLGFILGARGQAKPSSDGSILYRLSALAVPDGHPDQGSAFDPASPCQSNASGPGTEFVLATGRFDGPGAYTIRVDADVPSNGATRTSCSGGSSSTATFTIDPTVVASLASGRVPPSTDGLADLITIALPAGGSGESHCARDAAVGPDGDVAGRDLTTGLGPSVVRRQIPRSGHWTCVARARVSYPETPDDWRNTRWSAPVAFDVISSFATTLKVVDRRPRRFTIAYSKMPPGSEGGVATLRISPGKNCPRVPAKTLRARIDQRLTARFTFVLPEKDKASLRNRVGVDAYGWLFRFAFSGTPLVDAGRLTAAGFVNPARFAGGHVLRTYPDIKRAYCTHTA